jgi:hypothetical protein
MATSNRQDNVTNKQNTLRSFGYEAYPKTANFPKPVKQLSEAAPIRARLGVLV